MAKGIREFLGATHACSVCGTSGRERNLGTTQEEADAARKPKHWVCSVDCADRLMGTDPEWDSIGWLR